MDVRTSAAQDTAQRTEEMIRPVELYEGVISPRLLQELRTHEGSPGAVSAYVSIDMKKWGGAEAAKIAAKNLFIEAQREVESRDLPADVRKHVLTNLQLAREAAVAAAGRRGTRALAVFCDDSTKFGIAIPVPWPIRPRWFMGSRFVTFPLEQVLHLSEKYCVCLTDKDDARIFLYYMGAIEERKDVYDEVPPHIHFPDPFRELEYNRKQIEYYNKHFDRTARALFELYQQEPFDHLIIGGLHECIGQFENHLHSYLRERVIARWDAEVQVITPSEVRERTEAEEQKIEEEHCRDLWRKIEEAGTAKASRGPEEVFAALWRHRVHALLVDPDAAITAGRCVSCRRLTLKSTCPECGAELNEVQDAVTEAMEEAIETGAIVKLWAKNPEIAAVGHMASLNRF